MIHKNVQNISIFIVNLKKDMEKKQHIQELCKKFGLDIEFIEAVYGKELLQSDINKVYSEKKSIEEIGRGLSRGEIGCALSHKMIYQRMIDENISEAVVFEDDTEFGQEFVNIIIDNNLFQGNADLVLLGYWYYGETNIDKLIHKQGKVDIDNGYKLVRFVQNMHGTYGYAISQIGAKKLLEYMQQNIYLPIDHYISDSNLVNVYGLCPPIVNISAKFNLETELEKERRALRNKYWYSKPSNLKIFLTSLKLFPFVRFFWRKFIEFRKELMLLCLRYQKPKEY